MSPELDTARIVSVVAELRKGLPAKLPNILVSKDLYPRGSLGRKSFPGSLEGKYRPEHLYTQPVGSIFHSGRMAPESITRQWLADNGELTVGQLLAFPVGELGKALKESYRTVDHAVSYFLADQVTTPYSKLIFSVAGGSNRPVPLENEYAQACAVFGALVQVEKDNPLYAALLRLNYGISSWRPQNIVKIARSSGLDYGDVYEGVKRAKKEIRPYVDRFAVTNLRSIAVNLGMTFKCELDVFADGSVGEVLNRADLVGMGVGELQLESYLNMSLREFLWKWDYVATQGGGYYNYRQVINKIMGWTSADKVKT